MRRMFDFHKIYKEKGMMGLFGSLILKKSIHKRRLNGVGKYLNYQILSKTKFIGRFSCVQDGNEIR